MPDGTLAPGVSILIPACNAERYLAETIESALAQPCALLEVIVVDDGSTDGTAAIARAFAPRVRLVQAPHRGLAAARNRGIAEAAGPWLLHLDADDLLLPQAIPTLLRHQAGAPGHDIVAGRFECFRSPDLPEDCAEYRLPDAPQSGHLPGVALVNAAAFRTHGGLDETFPLNADLEWLVRARDQGLRLHQVDDVVMRRRIHGRNMSLVRKAEMAAANLRIVRGSLARRARACPASAAPTRAAP